MVIPKERLAWLGTKGVSCTLAHMARGIERETLRVTSNGDIAQSPHPLALGSTLCHDGITTDYSEALLELITKPHKSIDACLYELEQLHGFVSCQLDQELLWPLSMPPRIHGEEDIPIARYGASVVGLMKHVYRQGLAVRYGRKMQSIAGIHYNLSYPDTFWEIYRQQFSPHLNLRQCKDEAYFHILRCFLTNGWILTLLTGNSPACHHSFISKALATEKQLARDSDFYEGEHACSLRMGGLGYHNPAQSNLFVCYDNVETYIHSLSRALDTPHEGYELTGLYNPQGHRHQLSTNVLQIENEFYGPIRPKQVAQSLERPTLALERRGVAYIEVRNIDIDPEAAVGITPQTAATIEIFMTSCLLQEAGVLNRQLTLLNSQRSEQTAMNGREPNALVPAALHYWEQLEPIALILSEANNSPLYKLAYDACLAQLKDPSQLKSAVTRERLKERSGANSYTDYALELARTHQKSLADQVAPQDFMEFVRRAEQSLEKFNQLPVATEKELDQTLELYFENLPQTDNRNCAALSD